MDRTPVEPVLRLTGRALREPRANGVARVATSNRRIRPAAPDDGGGADSAVLHFTHRISLLCEDIVWRTPLFAHIDMRRVLVTFTRCRNRRSWGLQAKLVPLRFRNGALIEKRHGHDYKIQRLFIDDLELRYVLSFYLPRFLNQSFDEKMITVFHELYHIGPDFSGDVRRFGKSGSVHGPCKRSYDQKMAGLVQEYMGKKPPAELIEFLRPTFAGLLDRYREIVGVHIPTPKLIPLKAAGR